MKFLIYSDVHFSEFSSIIRGHGYKYSTRLENLIQSLNWAESIALKENCDEIICLGDFFDRSDLNSKEITALNEINWADLPHTCLVGNHDASSRNLIYNSVNALKKYNFKIINEPCLRHLGNCDLLFLPYFLDEDRKTIKEYFDYFYSGSSFNRKGLRKVILSHNDIKGFQYGGFESKNGISLDDIDKECNLFLNGHLHNSDGKPFIPHAFNVGNLTGQNFSEDASKYSHRVYILDTDKGSLNSVENPYAFNFYKLEILNELEFEKTKDFIVDQLKNNAVISIKCEMKFKEDLLQLLGQESITQKLIETRIIYSQQKSEIEQNLEEESISSISSQDYLQKFIEFCKEHINNTSILEEELNEVCVK